MNKSYVFEYLNENEYNKLERSVKIQYVSL